MADEVRVNPDTSVAQIQAEFRKVSEELALRVNQLRDLRTELEKERGEYGEQLTGLAEGQHRLEAEIAKLQDKQTELQRAYNAPRLSGEQADKIEQDKQLGAFLKFCRFAAGSGDALTAEEKRALYPDGKAYSMATEPGEWKQLRPEHARALVENTTGQILVPESFDTSIMQTVEETSIIRPLATVRTVSSDREKYRKMTQFSVTYGEALELAGSATESNITPSEAYQYIEDAYGLAYFGVNELMDADVDLVAYMVDSFARAKRETEDQKFLLGAGHASHEPGGLIDTSTLTAITAANAASIIFEDLVDLQYGYDSGSSTPLPTTNRNRGIYIMHPFTELACMKLRGDGGGGAGTGDFLWQPALTAGAPNTIWGHAVYTSMNMAAVGTGNESVYFGDVRQTYRILDRQGMTMQRLVEIKATAGLVGFLFKFRNTGGIVDATASRVLSHP